ncbi:PKD domain-containing protein [Pedobacter sp. LMG 31464]|uniref:PKD domain-containing protein n=1 Tax=Pedobacter planticolens TaxID=2679964 RepID=A0A923E0K1_9SPHI|nr:PKD domain-containing protein [Pedobacter planticolens]MBB2145267.1 PKD domain-containing protein [Pedobacter planticolens]
MRSKLLIGNALIKKLYLVITLFLLLGLSQNVLAQNTSNKGKDFWVAYSGHVDDLASRLTLFLSADKVTNYQIYIGNTLIQSSTTAPNTSIAANTCLPITIDPNATGQPLVYIGSSDDVVNEVDKAIHVITDEPISLYSVISNNRRTGGTMVLPSNTLGKEYYTYSYKNEGTAFSGYAEFTIIATEDDTKIDITPTANERYGKRQSGVPYQITLKKGQIYQYQSLNNEDLTGSHIKSVEGCKPIAVFSGNTWAAFCQQGGPRGSSGDNLYQQLFPLSAWGKKFVTAPFYNTINGNTDVLKVIIGEDKTTLTVNGSIIVINGSSLLPKGYVYSFSSTTANVISADKPISVAQYQTSQNCNINNSGNNKPYLGDPEITVLNPVEQTLNNITVFSDLKAVVGNLTNIDKYFLNVIIKTVDASSFRLDGNPVTGFTAIDAEYSYIIINVTGTQPQHRLTAASGFSAIAYGYGDIESYAYLAGANIQDFTFQTENASTNQPINVGCIDESMKLKVNLPYLATNLKWEIDGHPLVDGPPDPALIKGPFKGPNGEDYYSYEYPSIIKYATPGDYTFLVTATKPSADACGATETLSIDFTVDPLPEALFTVATEECANQEVTFTDASNPNVDGKVITKWFWDFGDPASGALNTSTEQNPKHAFTNQGTYTIKLSVGAENGCMSDVVPHDITIYPVPETKFSVPSTCINTPFTFTDASTISTAVFTDAKITNWHWDFGDGASDDRPDASSPNHPYTTAGTYKITLTTTSNKGCTSTVYHDIIVTGLPIADFTTPDFCLADGFANFINKSKDQNGTEVGLTYLWDFGDPTSGVANNSSILKDGKHAYAATGNYTVKLTITNINGCTDEKSYPFTVNGAVTKADFTVKNEANLCSGKDVIINSTSATAFGNVTKVEIYPDFVNNPTNFIIVPYPKLPISDDIALTYAPFGGNTNKTYTVKLVAYSGESCTLFTTHNITIKPAPQLTFAAILPVCENIGNIIINQAAESSGIIGTGAYSGAGIKPDGTFDPKLAGPGVHHLTYTFIPQNGCTVSIGQDIEVYPIPTTDAGADFYILLGGEKKMDAKATGTGLKYKWTPTIGLSAYDILNPIAKPEVDTEYTLTVTSDQGCTTVDQVYVYVLQNVNAPNSFTPNGDGVNDVWNVKYLDTYPNSSVEVFDRNGQRVYFSSKGYSVPFDGNYKNQALPVGTYYYIINPNSGRKSITGNLTIIR